MPLDLARIKALCFDVDGTLRDTDDHYVHQITAALHPIRWLLPGRDAHRAARWLVMRVEGPANTLIGIPDRLGLDDELAAVYRLVHPGQDRPEKPMSIVPGARRAVESLAPKYKLAVVTARGGHDTYAFLRQHHLEEHVGPIATALTVHRTKPHPAPILWAAEQMEVEPRECLMIGDTTIDIRAGKAAGAQTVGVLSGFGERPELEKLGADLVLPSVAELAPILLGHTD
ncbi:MAG: HAD family hydrolase [Anaerolineae bacterium]|nr:HAD family hydrolase [Anaerolineae bacterium]